METKADQSSTSKLYTFLLQRVFIDLLGSPSPDMIVQLKGNQQKSRCMETKLFVDNYSCIYFVQCNQNFHLKIYCKESMLFKSTVNQLMYTLPYILLPSQATLKALH